MADIRPNYDWDKPGASSPTKAAIEYDLIAAGISIATIGAVNGLGSKLNTNFTSINNSLR